MSDYTSLILTEFWALIGYAFLGLLIGSLIVYTLHKVGYLERKHLFLKVISKLYFVLLPILFFIYFWFAGTVWVMGNAIMKSVDEVFVELQERLYPVFTDYLNTQIKEIIHLDEIPSNEEIVAQFLSENSESSTNEEGSVYQVTLRLALKKTLDVTLGNDDLDREARVAALSSMSSTKAFEYGFDTLKSGIERQVRQFLALFLAPLTLIFFGLLIIIAIEIFISIKYLNKIEEEEI